MKSSPAVAYTDATVDQYNDLRDDARGASYLLAHEQDTPNMTVRVQDGMFQDAAGVVVSITAKNSGTFTAPSGNPRIDALSIDSSGDLTITQGTEAASPSAPITPFGEYLLAHVYIPVGATSIKDTDDGSNGYILDRRGFLVANKDGENTIEAVAAEDLAQYQVIRINEEGKAAALKKKIASFMPTTGARANIGSIAQTEVVAMPISATKRRRNDVIAINDNTFVTAYQGASSDVRVCVGTVDVDDTLDCTLETPVAVSGLFTVSTTEANISLAKLDGTRFALCANSGTGQAAVVIGEVDLLDNSVSFGSVYTETATDRLTSLIMQRVRDDKIVLVSANGDGYYDAFVATISGTVVTFGTSSARLPYYTSPANVYTAIADVVTFIDGARELALVYPSNPSTGYSASMLDVSSDSAAPTTVPAGYASATMLSGGTFIQRAIKVTDDKLVAVGGKTGTTNGFQYAVGRLTTNAVGFISKITSSAVLPHDYWNDSTNTEAAEIAMIDEETFLTFVGDENIDTGIQIQVVKIIEGQNSTRDSIQAELSLGGLSIFSDGYTHNNFAATSFPASRVALLAFTRNTTTDTPLLIAIGVPELAEYLEVSDAVAVSNAAVASGATGQFSIIGTRIENQVGLTPGEKHYLDRDGVFSATSLEYSGGVSLTNGELLTKIEPLSPVSKSYRFYDTSIGLNDLIEITHDLGRLPKRLRVNASDSQSVSCYGFADLEKGTQVCIDKYDTGTGTANLDDRSGYIMYFDYSTGEGYVIQEINETTIVFRKVVHTNAHAIALLVEID